MTDEDDVLILEWRLTSERYPEMGAFREDRVFYFNADKQDAIEYIENLPGDQRFIVIARGRGDVQDHFEGRS